MDFLRSIIQTLQQVPADVWSLAAQSVISAIAISPIALGFKKWWKVHSEKIMLVIVIAGSIITPVVIYLLQNPSYAPWLVPIIAAVTFATTQPVYIFFVKPIYQRVANWFAVQVAQAAALNETKSAEVPVTGLPIGTTSDDTKQV